MAECVQADLQSCGRIKASSSCTVFFMYILPLTLCASALERSRPGAATRNVRTSKLRNLAAVFVMCVGFSASAHDTWLASDQRVLSNGAELNLQMTSGERFPMLGSVIAPNRIARSACQQGAATFDFKPGRREPKALRLTATPPEAGAVTCWVQLAPRTLELKEAEVAHYLDEVDAPTSVRQAWENAALPRRWVETYTKNAKVVVPAETASKGLPSGPPVGLKLELVLRADLSAGRSVGDFSVQALLDGRPQAGLSVALTGEGPDKPQRARTNANGEASFKAPGLGRWMLSATDLRPAEQRPGEWESQFTTLVFEILSEGR